jgi:uncharacterized protein (DUF433 family)
MDTTAHDEDLPYEEDPSREPARQLAPRIESSPQRVGGKPVIAGTRMSVELLLEELASGYTVDDLLHAHPFLTLDDVYAALAYAAQRVSVPDNDTARAAS